MEKEFDEEDAIAKLNMSPLYSKIKDIFSNKSIFEITSTHRSEKMHSNFLKWLLTEESFCKRKDTPLIWFLDILMKRAKEQKITVDNNLKNKILARSIDITINKLELEKETTGVSLSTKGKQKTGRIDLLISCSIKDFNQFDKLTICIENKVDSEEHDDQTLKYYHYLTGARGSNVAFDEKKYNYKKGNKEYQLFVFLTPRSNLELDNIIAENKRICSCDEYIIINYQDLMDYILERIDNQQQLTERIRFIIEEYINTLSLPYFDNFETNKYPIMAMDEKKRNLLSEFWIENKDLILAAVTAYANDDKTPAEEQIIASQVADTINSKRHKFCIQNDENKTIKKDLSMPDIAKEVAKCIVENGEKVIEEANECIKNIKGNKWSTFQYILTEEQYDSERRAKKENKWKPIKVSQGTYYISTQWGYDVNFTSFLDLIKEKKWLGDKKVTENDIQS